MFKRTGCFCYSDLASQGGLGLDVAGLVVAGGLAGGHGLVKVLHGLEVAVDAVLLGGRVPERRVVETVLNCKQLSRLKLQAYVKDYIAMINL